MNPEKQTLGEMRRDLERRQGDARDRLTKAQQDLAEVTEALSHVDALLALGKTNGERGRGKPQREGAAKPPRPPVSLFDVLGPQRSPSLRQRTRDALLKVLSQSEALTQPEMLRRVQAAGIPARKQEISAVVTSLKKEGLVREEQAPMGSLARIAYRLA